MTPHTSRSSEKIEGYRFLRTIEGGKYEILKSYKELERKAEAKIIANRNEYTFDIYLRIKDKNNHRHYFKWHDCGCDYCTVIKVCKCGKIL